MKYTVLLLRPDYIADEFGKDTYLAWVEAPSIKHAVEVAQMEVWVDDNGGPDSPEEAIGEDTDYHVLFVCEGHMADLKP